jgi:hypothetical protein
MKKIFVTMCVAFLAVMSFNSCSKEDKTDTEILNELVGHSYTGTFDAGDAGKFNYQLDITTTEKFVLVDGKESDKLGGTVKVVAGSLILSVKNASWGDVSVADADLPTTEAFDITVGVDGTTLSLPTYNTTDNTYTGTAVKLKQK